MNLDEAKAAFSDAMRNDVMSDLIAAPGPLNDDEYISVRQQLYRRIQLLESGVVIPVSTDEIMHIRV